jgi:hypothetical protein
MPHANSDYRMEKSWHDLITESHQAPFRLEEFGRYPQTQADRLTGAYKIGNIGRVSRYALQ